MTGGTREAWGQARAKQARRAGRHDPLVPKHTSCAGRSRAALGVIGDMMNVWDIPDWLEREVMERDTCCVYCGIEMTEKMPPHGPRKAVATWEHIINDAQIVSRENIARCCVACNSSKGPKNLSDWLPSRYCMKRGINKDTVSEVVKKALLRATLKDARPRAARLARA